MSKRKNNTFEIGFEKQLWEAADKLRGSMDASQYKYIILGLIFLKYLSDIFEKKYKELIEEGDGLENDVDAYLADNIFFVPEDARWEVIADKAHTPEIGITINNAMQSIENSNPKLKNILPNDFADPDLNQQRLGDVVDLFTNIKIQENANEKDILGRCYEYCLGQFASKEGKNAGEFYTPSCIVRTIVEILQPFEGRIYDPCCGAGGMFVQSAKFVNAHGGNLGNISVFGQESNPTTWKLAQMNMAIRGIDADLGPYAGDTFTNDLHAHEKMDFIMANPPFNNKEW